MNASTAAYVGAALFVGLMAAFSSIGNAAPTGGFLLLLGILGITSHLVLLPVVSATGRFPWARACGYSWIAIDVMLNVASVNGMTLDAVTPFRLGAHVLVAVWIADAAVAAGALVRLVGLVLAALLAFHAMASPWIPMWVIFIPFMLIPVWLVLLGRAMQRSTTASVSGFSRT